MSVSKFFSFIFGILGTALMLLILMLTLTSLNGEVKIAEIPAEAVACTEQLMDALKDGDYVTAENLLYGDTTLGQPREATTEEGKLVWRVFADSFTYEFNGSCYGADNGIYRDVTITSLDITHIPVSLPARAQALLEQRKADAQEVNNMDLIYEEDGSIKETVLDSVVETAIAEALAENAKTMTTTVTLKLANEDGVWQVMPSKELLKAVSGGL